jgi:hypothetical protein
MMSRVGHKQQMLALLVKVVAQGSDKTVTAKIRRAWEVEQSGEWQVSRRQYLREGSRAVQGQRTTVARELSAS